MAKSRRITFLLLLGVVLLLPVVVIVLIINTNQNPVSTVFDENRAYQDVVTQCNFGARTPGSDAHEKAIDYIQSELRTAGWDVSLQEATALGHPVKNIVAKRGNSGKWVILGAHYDSRFVADNDSDATKQARPVIGANDGASGVAVLLELARTLPEDLQKEVWLVFFDTEDQGNIPGWDWILGSTEFVKTLPGKPDAAVVIDMIGDADLNIYREISSNIEITDAIWNTARLLGYESAFINKERYSMLDDHTPFLEAGIPAIDIIDFDYPYWHTSEDTADKVSPESLGIIGKTLTEWLIND